MSLQRTPPSLPPQTLSEPSHTPVDSLPPLEKSYLSRLFEYASNKTREHQKVELIAGAILSVIVALVSGSAAGITSGAAAALVTLGATLGLIFFINFLTAPKALDKDLRERLRLAQTARQAEIETLTTRHEAHTAALQTEIASLQAGFYELSNFMLKLDVDTTQTRVRADESVNGCHIFIGVRMRFDNGDRDTLTVKALSLTPNKRSDTGDVRELERGVPSIHSNLFSFFLDDDFGELAARRSFEQLPVEGRTVTKYYWLKADITIALLKNSDLIEGKHFLRLTMLATNQPPFIVDIDVDWRKAMFGFTPVAISHPHPLQRGVPLASS